MDKSWALMLSPTTLLAAQNSGKTPLFPHT